MSERARAFVESWVKEYVHPVGYEDANHHSKSRANAIACYESALIEGITKTEIDEEYDDLVTYMVNARKGIIDQEIANKVSSTE
jgi:hypothetical protein